MTDDHNPDADLLPPAVARAAEQHRPDYTPTPRGPWSHLSADELAAIAADDDAGPELDPDDQAALDAWMDSLVTPAADAPPPAREASADERASQPGGPLRTRLINGVDILNLPEPVYLVDGIIQAQAITTLVGPPGCGKTFLGLDLALSTLAGASHWQGRKLTADPTRSVMWLAGEGLHEAGKRARAWCAHHGIDPDDILPRLWVLDGGLALQDPTQAALLIEMVADVDPQLVIVDTLARHMVGGEENGGKDMGLAVDAAERIAQLDAAVILVHHTGKDVSKGGRGHTSLLGGIRSELTVSGGDGWLHVKHTKSNNGALDHGWDAQLTPAGTDPKTGGHLSMVPVVASGPPKVRTADDTDRMDRVLDALMDLDTGDGVTHTDWKREALSVHPDGRPGVTDHYFRRAIKILQDEHKVMKQGNTGAGQRGRWYWVDPEPQLDI